MTRILVLLAFSTPALAEDQISRESHFELAVGFLGGARSYGDAPFVVVSGAEGMAGLDAPFVRVPFEQSAVFGPRWESRMVLERLRLTLGYQRPYTTWSERRATRAADADGEQLSIEARGLRANELRFGLGVEPPGGRVTPFLDLVGDIAWVSTDLAIGGQAATYRSEAFSLAPRVGLRIACAEHVFVELAGEYGLVGPNDWGAQLMVGVAMF